MMPISRKTVSGIMSNVRAGYVRWRFFLSFVIAYRRHILLLQLLSLAAAALLIVQPLIVKYCIDQGIALKHVQVVWVCGVALAVLYGAGMAVRAVQRLRQTWCREKIVFTLRKRTVRALAALPLGRRVDTRSSEELYMLQFDAEQVADMLMRLVVDPVRSCIKAIGLFGVLLWLCWPLAVVDLVMFPLLIVPAYLVARMFRKKWEFIREHIVAAQNSFFDLVTHAWIVKAFCSERLFISRVLRQYSSVMRADLDVCRMDVIQSNLSDSALKLLGGVLVVFGLVQIFKGSLTLGTLLAIIAWFMQLLQAQFEMVAVIKQLARVDPSARRVYGLLATRDDTTVPYTSIRPAGSEVRIDGISFSYGEARIFSKLACEFPRASLVGVVGASGSGKSTLVHLLCGLLRAEEGRIIVGGTVLYQSPQWYASGGTIAVSLQKPALFSDTVKNNVTLYDDAVTGDEIEKALAVCGCGFVHDLPQGLASQIGELGDRLSEGQRQRLSLVRAFLRRPRVLIIDEGLSSLDSESEAGIVRGLRAGLPDSTIILVSHRLSTIAQCDYICYLDPENGVVAGPAQALWASSAGLKAFFHEQLAMAERVMAYGK